MKPPSYSILAPLVLVIGLVAVGSPTQVLAVPSVPVFIDQYTVIRNGTQVFQDNFDDGVPPPDFSGNPFAYFTAGTLDEVGGKVRLDTDGALVTPPGAPNAFGGAQLISIEQAVRNTNIDPGLPDFGLNVNSTFSITGVFDVTPPGPNFEAHGLRFVDGRPGPPFDDVLALLVRRAGDSQVRVEFARFDFGAGTFTQIENVLFDAQHDQIHLRLARLDTANNDITASFAYFDQGTGLGPFTTFSSTDTIFNGEDFTRGSFVFLSPVPIPEPASLLLLGSSLAGVAAWRRRRGCAG